MKETLLITGGAGYIGSHVVLALMDRGYGAVVLDDLSTGDTRLVAEGTKFYHGDIADTALLSQIFAEQKISAVMHFAAKLIVPESVAFPGKYFDHNVTRFSALLNAARTAKVPHFIFSSTAAVYGEPREIPVAEDSACAPINPYGESKLRAEELLRQNRMSHVILRYFNVAGADPALRTGQITPHATHLIKVAAEVATGKRPGMEIFGTDYPTPDGTCIRDYIHVSDLAHAHIRALEYLRMGGDSVTLNCGYGRGYSVREVIDAVAKASGRALNITESPRRAGDPAVLVAKADKLREILKWKPYHDDLRAIVESALAWEEKTA